MQHVMIPHNVATNQAEGQTEGIMSPHRIGQGQQMSILMDFIASFLNLLKWDREFIIARIECQENSLNSKFYNDLGVSPNSIVTLIQTKLFPLRKVNF